jgi:hypothetical protein
MGEGDPNRLGEKGEGYHRHLLVAKAALQLVSWGDTLWRIERGVGTLQQPRGKGHLLVVRAALQQVRRAG